MHPLPAWTASNPCPHRRAGGTPPHSMPFLHGMTAPLLSRSTARGTGAVCVWVWVREGGRRAGGSGSRKPGEQCVAWTHTCRVHPARGRPSPSLSQNRSHEPCTHPAFPQTPRPHKRRQTPAGYRVVSVGFDSTGAPTGVTPFLSGFLEGDAAQPDCPAQSSAGSLAVTGETPGREGLRGDAGSAVPVVEQTCRGRPLADGCMHACTRVFARSAPRRGGSAFLVRVDGTGRTVPAARLPRHGSHDGSAGSSTCRPACGREAAPRRLAAPLRRQGGQGLQDSLHWPRRHRGRQHNRGGLSGRGWHARHAFASTWLRHAALRASEGRPTSSPPPPGTSCMSWAAPPDPCLPHHAP